VRLVALIVLLIGNLFANQVLAEDVSSQPLTRVESGACMFSMLSRSLAASSIIVVAAVYGRQGGAILDWLSRCGLVTECG
jgi:hypothetical protein